MDRISKIAQLNDEFRKTFNPNAGKVVITQGFNALPTNTQVEFIRLIQTFNAFSADNDPYGEHDFGSVEHKKEKVFWKIDYYNPSMTMHSEDAADPEKTKRVMTIMLANEY